ncbi:hypothetical protein Mpt1_c01690 [Candidatus Methanoplasma termitum]|uniref:Uncharacterized protein n=1 Tax=Candidatus Methanoplasma termitum TaxID=1577791 RepID=A0A0A7LAB2_9ARCH|nr:hypothetical protein [Candidatus Methanoplasma termitum]AIZ56070.1 hypothetical protein Mpt1_c01690 [Candidatus Methanoplasma termitum]MCL2333800.1 hypothetical protein [Candidatus Methanoplasma sp.]
MAKVDKRIWVILDVIGMILLAVGALRIMTMFPQPKDAVPLIIIGIALIVVASVFIFLMGRELRIEDAEFRRFEDIRDSARMVPNDLDEGYVIDYTADPDDAIFYMYNRTDPGDDDQGIRSDEMIVYFE